MTEFSVAETAFGTWRITLPSGMVLTVTNDGLIADVPKFEAAFIVVTCDHCGATVRDVRVDVPDARLDPDGYRSSATQAGYDAADDFEAHLLVCPAS